MRPFANSLQGGLAQLWLTARGEGSIAARRAAVSAPGLTSDEWNTDERLRTVLVAESGFDLELFDEAGSGRRSRVQLGVRYGRRWLALSSHTHILPKRSTAYSISVILTASRVGRPALRREIARTGRAERERKKKRKDLAVRASWRMLGGER